MPMKHLFPVCLLLAAIPFLPACRHAAPLPPEEKVHYIPDQSSETNNAIHALNQTNDVQQEQLKDIQQQLNQPPQPSSESAKSFMSSPSTIMNGLIIPVWPGASLYTA